MNIYIATGNNMVGLALTNSDNQVGYYKAFETRSNNKDEQIILACQRAVCYIVANKPLDNTNTLGIYSDKPVDLEKIHGNEYIKRHGFNFEPKQITTDKEKNAMLTARVEIDMQTRRNIIQGKCR